MFLKKLPHILVTLLIAVMIGCGASNPLADEAQSNIENQDFEAALASAEKSIKEYPGDPMGYYYKAVALGEIADTEKNPAERAEYYEQMNEAFNTAKSIADTTEDTPSELNRMDVVKNVLWQREHNVAIEYIRDDSLKNTVDNPNQYSMNHLKNATTIQPDSSLSWNVLSQVSAMNQEYEEAVDSKERYMSMVPDTSITPDDYLQLASYHYNLDNQQKVVEVFEKAQKQYPENEDIISNLADSYNRVGQPDKAIATVEQLVEQNPENPQYHLVLGTQIYQKALNIRDSLSANSQKIRSLQQKFNDASASERQKIKNQISTLSEENKQLQSEVDDLTNRAEESLKTTLEYRPEDANAYNTLGIIYQNKARTVFDRRNAVPTDDNERYEELDKMGRDILRESMGYYEKAAEIDPENAAYWERLFEIYTTLGMDEKAQEAMNKAGIDK
jgi:tetratricopeptide (TPR) repeat protein